MLMVMINETFKHVVLIRFSTSLYFSPTVRLNLDGRVQEWRQPFST